MSRWFLHCHQVLSLDRNRAISWQTFWVTVGEIAQEELIMYVGCIIFNRARFRILLMFILYEVPFSSVYNLFLTLNYNNIINNNNYIFLYIYVCLHKTQHRKILVCVNLFGNKLWLWLWFWTEAAPLCYYPLIIYIYYFRFSMSVFKWKRRWQQAASSGPWKKYSLYYNKQEKTVLPAGKFCYWENNVTGEIRTHDWRRLKYSLIFRLKIHCKIRAGSLYE